jgi:hypothetical protein
VAPVKRAAGVLLLATLLALVRAQAGGAGASSVPASEQQLKAVVVFNFTHFVGWPPESLATPDAPFVIGVLGSDDFTTQLERAVRGEQVDSHPLVVRHYHSPDEVQDPRILYVERSRGADLERALLRAGPRGTLTVSDVDDAIGKGVMIQLAMEDNRIRLAINADTARSAGLAVSSNLLRLARKQGN